MLSALILVFFLSGAAALLFENLWFHQAGLTFGNSVWASSLVLAAFMGGLAVGNGVIARFGHRIERPVRLYAGLELVIGVTGLALVHLLPQLTPLFASLLRPFVDAPWILNALRLTLGFGLLLAPATAMGATLPLLVGAFYRRDPNFGRALGRLYGWNTLGAVAGALLGPLFAVEQWGIRGAGLFAAGLNVAAAVIAMAAAGRLEQQIARRAAPRPVSARATSLLAAAFLSGAVLLGLEVVWFRFLLLFFAGTDTVFASMLAVILTGIGVGGLIGSRWLSWQAGASRAVPAVAALSGALCVLLYAQLDLLLDSPIRGVGFMIAAALMLPIALLSGVTFTLLGDALHGETGDETRAAGLLVLANTTGAMLGPLVVGFAGLPLLGLEPSLRLLCAGYAGVALFALAARLLPETRPARAGLALVGVALASAILAFPTGALDRKYLARVVARNNPDGSYRVVGYRDGLNETITYLQRDAWGMPRAYRMLTNGHPMSSTSTLALRYMRLYVQWPVAVHPDLRHALLISYGVGVTAKALTDTQSLATIDVVDISPDVLEMNDIVYPDPADHPLHDPRVRVHLEDGRYFLQTTERRFDLITGEPPPPKNAGVVNLYTREYFELMRSRLAEGGMVTYWLPVQTLLPEDTKTIVRAFCDAFDDCSLWRGSALNWMLIGTRDAQQRVTERHFARQWRDPVVGPQLREGGIERPEQLGSMFLASRDELLARVGDTPPLTDDHPKRLSDETASIAANLDYYTGWMDTRRAAEDFMRSELVERLWPPRLREQTRPYFEWQQATDLIFMPGETSDGAMLTQLEHIFDHSSLRTLALWRMGSGAAYERLAKLADARGDRGRDLDYHLGVAAMADRDFERAVELFTRSSEPTTPLQLYALCRAGEGERALAILDRGTYPVALRVTLRRSCAPDGVAGRAAN
jgi:predicted membrane-bound spermidine synthase